MAGRVRRLSGERRELALSAARVIEGVVLRGVSRGLRRSFGVEEWHQEAWLAVCKAAHDIDPERHPGVPFRAYATNGARLHLMGVTRKFAKRLCVWRGCPDDAHPADHRGPVVPALLSAWCSDEYRAQRACLTWRERVILYLRLVEGWYQPEVAAAFGLSKARIGQLEEAAVRRLASSRVRRLGLGVRVGGGR